MRRFVPVLLLCLVVGAVALARLAAAQTIFEKMVMPGDLAKAHAKYEPTCNKCHTPFERKGQTSLCIDCHDKVAADRKAGQGFHGRSPLAAKQECRHCHAEHKGREADIVGLDATTFNHDLTDFRLDGRHRQATCTGCHAIGKPNRDAPSQCASCHKSDDKHRGQLGDNCASCHQAAGWAKVGKFDHDKTKFPLRDGHAKAPCGSCHSGEIYKNVSTQCVSCHAVNDVHSGTLGKRCETCHVSTKWTKVKFDHARDTKFPLRGRHASAKCSACHAGSAFDVKLPTECSGCHGKQDPHKGTQGTRCESCHNEAGWHTKVAFDHDLTRFPLIGLHAAVSCDACHKSKDFKSAPTRCSACHADGVHGGRLGSECVRCHTPNGWKRWMFDHAREARFPLTGSHAGLDCHACHRKPAQGRVSAPRDCYGCHAADDAHQGSFGRGCEACHSTNSFRDLRR